MRFIPKSKNPEVCFVVKSSKLPNIIIEFFEEFSIVC